MYFSPLSSLISLRAWKRQTSSCRGEARMTSPSIWSSNKSWHSSSREVIFRMCRWETLMNFACIEPLFWAKIFEKFKSPLKLTKMRICKWIFSGYDQSASAKYRQELICRGPMADDVPQNLILIDQTPQVRGLHTFIRDRRTKRSEN